eukprot:4970335-Pleurochrysis_carterae.AAC.3
MSSERDRLTYPCFSCTAVEGAQVGVARGPLAHVPDLSERGSHTRRSRHRQGQMCWSSARADKNKNR